MREAYKERREVNTDDINRIKRIILEYIEDHQLTLIKSSNAIVKARYYSKLTPRIYYECIWRMDRDKDDVQLDFSFLLTPVVNRLIHFLRALAGLVLLASTLLIPPPIMYAGQLFALSIIVLSMYHKDIEEQAKDFWNMLPANSLETKIRKPHEKVSKVGLIVVGLLAVIFGLVDVPLWFYWNQSGLLGPLLNLIACLLLIGLGVLLLVYWFQPFDKELEGYGAIVSLGTAMQAAVVTPLILPLLVDEVGSDFFLFFGVASFVLWAAILVVIWYISQIDLGELKSLGFEGKLSENPYPKISPPGKRVLAYWLSITLITFLGVPLVVFLGPGGSLIPKQAEPHPALAWVFAISLCLPAFFTVVCLGFENIKTAIRNHQAIREASNLTLDSSKAWKLKKIAAFFKTESEEFKDRYAQLKVLPLESNSVECKSFTTGIFRLNGYIFIPTLVLGKFDLDELEALVLHELSHLKRDSHLLARLRILSKVTLFGNGFLAAVVDFAGREYLADKYAADRMGPQKVIGVLRKIRRISVATEITDKLRGLHFDFPHPIHREEVGKLRKVHRMVFGNYIPLYSSPTLGDRIESLKAYRAKNGR